MTDEIKLNEKLVSERGLSEEDVFVIKALHKKLNIVASDPESYHDPVNVITSIETVLQVLWGFPTLKRFHRYWSTIKGCTCPTMDSRELYGTGLKWRNGDCPWHDLGKK